MAGFNLKPQRTKSWSNSRFNDYDKCPAYFNYKHHMKLPEPKSEPMARGVEIAQIEEGFFGGQIIKTRTHPNGKKFGLADLKKVVHPNVIGDLTAAKKKPTMFFEQNWGFNSTWQEVDYFDWTNCKLRVKVDFGWQEDGWVHLRDNKTGKFSEYDVEKYVQQLNLYTAAGASRFPKALGFKSQLIYTDLGIRYPAIEPTTVLMKDAVKLQKKWDKLILPMFNDTRFDPKPNRGCQWCAFSKAKGGPCKY